MTEGFAPKVDGFDHFEYGNHKSLKKSITNRTAAIMVETVLGEGGIKVINAACEKLKDKHSEHIKVYGAHNEERLTGLHETCSIKEFRYGISDRGASIRIPWQVAQDGKGYIEDRRPNANADPYVVATLLTNTCCSALA